MKKILFVDDDENILLVLKYMLKNYNFNLDICNDSNEALQLALKEDFDLIITDYMMPNLNGIELIKIIKKSKNNPLFVLISGALTDEIVEEARIVGIDNIMQKPFDIAKIITLLGYIDSEQE